MQLRYDPLGNNRDGIALTHINASNLCESIDRARSLKPCSLFNHSIAVGHSVQTAKRVTVNALINDYKGVERALICKNLNLTQIFIGIN